MSAPTGWKHVPISDIAEVNPGPSRPLVDEEQVSFVPMASVREGGGGIGAAATRRTGEVRRKSYRYFEEGDVIMAKITPCFENGKIAVARGLRSGRAFGSTEFHVLRPRSGAVDATFLEYYLESPAFTSPATRSMSGAVGQQRVPTRFVADALIPLPPLDQQRAVVSVIDEQLSRLGAGIRSLSMAAKRLSRLRQQALDILVGGTASSPSLPSGWSFCRLGDLLMGIDAGKSFKCEERPARADEWGVIKVSAMTWGEFDERENKTVTTPEQINPTYEIQPGDLLLSRANTVEYVGAAVFVERCRPHLLLSDKSMRLRPAATADPRWLRLALGSTHVRRQIMDKATGTSDSMRNISQAKVRQLGIHTPPKDQQAEIAREWSRLSSQLDSAARTLTANMARSTQLRRAILVAAFTGRLPVRAVLGHAESMTELQDLTRTAE